MLIIYDEAEEISTTLWESWEKVDARITVLVNEEDTQEE